MTDFMEPNGVTDEYESPSYQGSIFLPTALIFGVIGLILGIFIGAGCF